MLVYDERECDKLDVQRGCTSYVIKSISTASMAFELFCEAIGENECYCGRNASQPERDGGMNNTVVRTAIQRAGRKGGKE